MPDTIRVDIISDVVCPWCYIGWSRLKAAAAGLEGVALDVHWLPFELNPDMPEAGADRHAYLAAKYGAARVDQINERIQSAADADGLAMRLDRVARSVPTLKAHRLLLLAEEAGKGTQVQERLFDDYFVQGRDIAETEVLADAAAAAGLPRHRVVEYLGTDVGREEVRELEAEAHRLGVQGVPFFIFGRHLGVSGAQPTLVMADALREALAAGRDGAPRADAG